jgi:hypothetical protein
MSFSHNSTPYFFLPIMVQVALTLTLPQQQAVFCASAEPLGKGK